MQHVLRIGIVVNPARVVGLACAFVIYRLLTRRPEGEGTVVKIAAAIHLGAMVFLQREYKMLALFAADPGLRPADVILMTPDIARYGPLIEAVFASAPRERRIPR